MRSATLPQTFGLVDPLPDLQDAGPRPAIVSGVRHSPRSLNSDIIYCMHHIFEQLCILDFKKSTSPNKKIPIFQQKANLKKKSTSLIKNKHIRTTKANTNIYGTDIIIYLSFTLIFM